MSWFGKMVGGAFGFVMAGPLGAILGATLGHQFDRPELDLRSLVGKVSPEDADQIQAAFCSSLFRLFGAMAKADGYVSESEITCARKMMQRLQLNDAQCLKAMHDFNRGKSEAFSPQNDFQPMWGGATSQPELNRLFMTLATEMALVDGKMAKAAESLLILICEHLPFSLYEFYGIRTRLEAELRFTVHRATPKPRRPYDHHRSPPPHGEKIYRNWIDHEGAYKTLGMSPTATDAEIKRAYRQLISRHHPDKLEAQGLTPSQIHRATEETQKIQKAYDAIRKMRSGPL